MIRSPHTGLGRHPGRGAGLTSSILSVGLVLVLGIGFWFSSNSELQAGMDEERTTLVELREVIDSVNANGRVEPLARVAVMSRASGIIEQLLVDEGDRVEPGQILAVLDREQLEAQEAQDRADLLAATARVAAAEARIVEAKVRLEDPEVEYLGREHERLAALEKKGSASVQEVEAAQRAHDSARFRIELARAAIPTLEAAVAEAEAGLAGAQADLERSATAVREATIRCSISGVVLVRDKEVGDGISSILTAGGNATQLMTLGDLSSMHVEARVDEVDLGRIHEGMSALITVDAHRGVRLDGKVERIAPAGSIDGNGIVTFEVHVSVEDPDGILRPDMTADAKLVIARRQDVPVLPHVAFERDEAGQWSVQRLVGTGDSRRIERVEVELGLSDGLMTEVAAGLEPGDRVVLRRAPPSRDRR